MPLEVFSMELEEVQTRHRDRVNFGPTWMTNPGPPERRKGLRFRQPDTGPPAALSTPRFAAIGPLDRVSTGLMWM
jgi:hypothetical protein